MTQLEQNRILETPICAHLNNINRQKPMAASSHIWIQFENFIEREFTRIKLFDKPRDFQRRTARERELKFPATGLIRRRIDRKIRYELP